MRHDRPRGTTQGGFTLVELLIVLAIIAIIAAIAIPNLLDARMRSNETSVIGAMRAIYAAQTLFKDRDLDGDGRHHYAPTLSALSGILEADLADGQRYSYTFELVSPAANTFGCRATCLFVGRAGENGYWVDETGVIRICAANFSDANDPPLP